MPSPFSISPIVEDDIPGICELSGAAFEKDRHTMLKASHPTRPYNHASGMGDGVKYWLSLPKEKVLAMKAVDDKTGQVIGIGVFGMRLSPPPPSQPYVKPPSNGVGQDYVKTDAPDLDGIARLGEHTSAHFADFQNRVMPDGVRCMYVMSVNIHPDHQGRGVGKALLNLATDRADQEDVFLWVHSSEDGAEFYRKCGFEVDDTLELDLDHWANLMDPAIPPPAGDEQWGTYTFRYMIRQPNRAKAA